MNRPRKMVSIDITGDINLSPILPIVDSPLFQALARRRQLGLAYLLFRSANHTRFSHSLGVYAATLKRAQMWMRMNFIDKESAWNLCLFGLLHDIGHGPYSHVIEPLSSRNHEENGLRNLDALASAINATGGDLDFIKQLFRGENKLAEAVLHGPLGTDKIDYLDRDALSAHIAGRPPVKTILHYTYLYRGLLTIDPKIMPEVMQLQTFYMHMYQRVYLRKMSLIAQRFFQRMVGEILAPSNGEDPELTEETLWQLDDGELDGIIHFSKNPNVQMWSTQLSIRELPHVAISVRIRTGDEPVTGGKRIAVFSLPSQQMTALLEALERPAALRRIEEEIDDLLNLPKHSVLIAPTLAAKRAFTPSDIAIHHPSGLRSLEEYYPAHYASLRERAQSYPAVFVCVPQNYRKQASSKEAAEEIYNILLNELS